jgi:hypothetical protein
MSPDNKTDQPNIYNAQIVSGSLLIPESRKIARLLLNGTAPESWHQAIVVNNILQKRSPATAKRQAKLIRNRLELMKPDLWVLVDKGSSDVVRQALLSAAIKHSRLLGDFMDKMLRENWRTFKRQIFPKDWDLFLEFCVQTDPEISAWSGTTLSKLRQVVFRILAEARYIDSTRSLKMLPVSIVPEVRNYLVANSEKYVLRCMEATR